MLLVTGFCEYYARIRCSAEDTPPVCRDLGHEGLAALARASRAPFDVCDDDDRNCADWAKKGECRANAAFMLSSCRRACGVCDGHVDTSTFFSEEEQHLGDWKWRAATDASLSPPAGVSDAAEIVSDAAEIVPDAAAGDAARDNARPPPSPPAGALATELHTDEISAFQRVATSRRAAAAADSPHPASAANAATAAADVRGAADGGRRPADDVAAVAPASTRHVAARAPASSTRSAKPISPNLAPRTDEASRTYSGFALTSL